ncbi:MAG TPA: helix-turn-helix domain-containing protein [Devosiaceae bacterium]|jgi:predicted transcriptional regulator|nr:helix-turn-helix domain-containing protein [Devosiaceae bacterium]
MSRNFLVVDPEDGLEVLKGLASSVRVRILKLLHMEGALNVNDIAAKLDLPQSTVSSNVQILETASLIRTETQKARKGNQKICHSTFDEVLVMFKEDIKPLRSNEIEVAMPLGLYTSCDVSAPCGLCSTESIIGLLDVPDTFLDPDRMKAGLIWFTSGYIEYQFPNNARLAKNEIQAIELTLEVSSEAPGTSTDWPSDITIWINGTEIGTWTSPGDYGDHRGVYTPDWWKLKGSQYGMLKTWRVDSRGTYVDGLRISDVKLAALDIEAHRSIRLRIGVKKDAKHPGGVNIFGRGFGNYDQDIILRLLTH